MQRERVAAAVAAVSVAAAVVAWVGWRRRKVYFRLVVPADCVYPRTSLVEFTCVFSKYAKVTTPNSCLENKADATYYRLPSIISTSQSVAKMGACQSPREKHGMYNLST